MLQTLIQQMTPIKIEDVQWADVEYGFISRVVQDIS